MNAGNNTVMPTDLISATRIDVNTY